MTGAAATQSPARCTAHREPGGALRLELTGVLTAVSLHRVWREALRELRTPEKPGRLLIDAGGVTHADGAGAGLLIDLQRRAARYAIPCEVVAATEQLRGLLDLYQPREFLGEPPPPPPELSVTEEVGYNTWLIWRDIQTQIAFIGELFTAIVRTLRHPQRMRWREVLVIAERAGVDALPIVILLGFLIGLIMAFQAAIPMRQFGVELFVADLIALSMVRELGALITAVILAGRTGSAFAAELGTMKINEEINALQTLGLEPVRFLVVGRVLATMLMTPLLTAFSILAGLLGGLVVMLSMDFTAITYFNEARGILSLSDLVTGVGKSIVFGLEIAGIGCMRGLQTRSGASAVGLSATRAVVTSIVVIIVTDGVFAVVFYYLGF
jgi:phospholipid/cholesterol/gamma-HCH transport system permease protein